MAVAMRWRIPQRRQSQTLGEVARYRDTPEPQERKQPGVEAQVGAFRISRQKATPLTSHKQKQLTISHQPVCRDAHSPHRGHVGRSFGSPWANGPPANWRTGYIWFRSLRPEAHDHHRGELDIQLALSQHLAHLRAQLAQVQPADHARLAPKSETE